MCNYCNRCTNICDLHVAAVWQMPLDLIDHWLVWTSHHGHSTMAQPFDLCLTAPSSSSCKCNCICLRSSDQNSTKRPNDKLNASFGKQWTWTTVMNGLSTIEKRIEYRCFSVIQIMHFIKLAFFFLLKAKSSSPKDPNKILFVFTQKY